MSDPLNPDMGQPVSGDYDGDQSPHLVIVDTNADGRADWVAEIDRSTGGITVAADTDDRPGMDVVARDADADGLFELVGHDLDGDHAADLIQADTDGDGFLDLAVYPDATTATADPATGMIVGVSPGRPPGEGQAQDADEFVHGDAAAEAQYSQIQTEDGFCAPVSVGMVLTEFFGRTVGESETVQAAIELELLTRDAAGWSGLTVIETEKLLEHFGIPAHIEPPVDENGNLIGQPPGPDEALENLIAHLDQNHSVIVAVDADETWTSIEDDGTFRDGEDHAVVVTEVNERDITVTINDPGNPDDGKAYVMATEDFLEAWDDSDFAMVVTDAAPGDIALQSADPTAPDTGAAAASGSHTGFVLLPVVIAARLLRRGSRT